MIQIIQAVFLRTGVSYLTECLIKPRMWSFWEETLFLQLEMCTISGQYRGGNQSCLISLRVFMTQRFCIYQKSIFKNKFLISV